MVLAAPLFLVAQTKAFAHFYQLNREPLLRMGLGVLAAWMGLRAISKSYEASKLAEEVELQAAKMQTIRACVADETMLHALLQELSKRNEIVSPTHPQKQSNGGWLSSSPSTSSPVPPSAGPLSPMLASLLSAELLRRADEAAREVEVVARATGRIAPIGSTPSSVTLSGQGEGGEAGSGGGTGRGLLAALTGGGGSMPDLPLPHTSRIAAARAKAREMIEGGGALSAGGTSTGSGGHKSQAAAGTGPTLARPAVHAAEASSASAAPPNLLVQKPASKVDEGATSAPRRFV